METSANFTNLINYLAHPKRNKYIAQISPILQSIPSLYKMVRIKGYGALKQLILKSNLIILQQNQQIFQSVTQFPLGFHILLEGTIDVYSLVNLKNQQKQIRVIGALKPGDIFGHTKQFLGSNIHKLETLQKCTILKLNVNDMYKLLDGVFVFQELINRLEQLRKVQILKHLDKKDLIKVIEHSKTVSYTMHQSIFKQGDEANNLLLLEKGQVQLYKVGQRVFRKQKFIDKLPICILVTPGDLLGIQQMMQNQRYKCYAESFSETCVITSIPMQIIKTLLKQTKVEKPKQFNQFKIQSKSRNKRVYTMIELNQKINKKQQMNEIKKGRLCFEQKNKILTQMNLTTRSSYISNKFNERTLFDNQQDFYTHKIKKIERFAINKYGKQFKAKFISLFGDDFMPPKKVTKDLLFRKTARTNAVANTARQNQTQEAQQKRSFSCGFYRLKKKIVDGNYENTKFTKTISTFA